MSADTNQENYTIADVGADLTEIGHKRRQLAQMLCAFCKQPVMRPHPKAMIPVRHPECERNHRAQLARENEANIAEGTRRMLAATVRDRLHDEHRRGYHANGRSRTGCEACGIARKLAGLLPVDEGGIPRALR